MEVGIAIVIMGAVAVGVAYVSSRYRAESAKAADASEESARQESARRAEDARTAEAERNALRRAREPQRSRRVEPVEFDPERIISLKGIESTRLRIRGQSYALSHDDRYEYSGTEYLLVRDPGNRHDANAVKVFFAGRPIGFISATKAAAMSPLLARLDADAFLVGGASTTDSSVRAWVDLPKIPELRAFVKSQTG